MPNCYLIAICQSSSLDQDSNNWSLFSIVEEVHAKLEKQGSVAVESPGASAVGEEEGTPLQTVPLETHIYLEFEPDELNVDFELRIAYQSSDGKIVGRSSVLPVNSPRRRFRLRATGLAMPPPDYYHIRVEWKEKEKDAWNLFEQKWPLEVKELS